MNKKVSEMTPEERREYVRKITHEICDKNDKALRMLAEQEKKERE